MDELIRTLAVLGRPFPPELREIYLQMEKDCRKRRRGLMNLQHATRTPPKTSRSSGARGSRARPPAAAATHTHPADLP